MCRPPTATGYSCDAQALYNAGAKHYVHPDLARPGINTRAAPMIVTAGRLGVGRAAGPFSPALPGAAAPSAAPAGESAPSPGTPAYLQQAYDLTALAATAGSGDRVAIVDAYVDSQAETDLNEYRVKFGLPRCEHANGCFTQVNESGGPPSPEACEPRSECEGWGVETSLDMDAVSAICPNCSIVLVEGRNAQEALATADSEAYTLGVSQVTDSWSGPLRLGLASSYGAVATVAASGDEGQWGTARTPEVPYPAAEDTVTAVGATKLLPPGVSGAAAARGVQESVWFEIIHREVAGTGSGCSPEAKPSWQLQTLCSGRSANDIAADGDPETGLMVYDPGAQGSQAGWLVVGGTSLSAPLTAAYYALIGRGTGDGSGEWDYANAARLNDVISGSNGSCGTLLCNAGPGYDGPTGNGSISGDAVLGAPGVAGASQVSGGYATCVSTSSVALSAGVYPNGLATEYWWEYGATTAYGQQTKAGAVGEAAPASGSGGVLPVGGAIEGLSAGTTYHYRLVARNADGTTYGYDSEFTVGAPGQPETKVPPAVTAAPTAKASVSSAAITAQVAPGNEEVNYTVEYGTSSAYGKETTVQHLPAGCAGVPAAAQLEGLQPATTYHVKLIATSAAGRAESADETFTTEAQPAPAPAPREPAGARPPEVGQAATPAAGTTVHPAAAPAAAQRTAQALARIVKVKVSGTNLIVTAHRPAGGSGKVSVLLQLTSDGKVLKAKRLALPAGASKTVKLKLTPALAALRQQAKRFTVQVVLRQAPVGKHGRAGKILASRSVTVR